MGSGLSPSATTGPLDRPTLCSSPPALTASRTASLEPSLPSTASTATKNKYQEFFPGKQANETAGVAKTYRRLFFCADHDDCLDTRRQCWNLTGGWQALSR